MHHALKIQEILLEIFCNCYSPRDGGRAADLAALARTCRAFKEPALDILWEQLHDLSPLARCLPGASLQLSPDEYSFGRSLTQVEWDILRSYACRVQSIRFSHRGSHQKFLVALPNPLTTDSLLPNLRHLRWEFNTAQAVLPLRFPLPSLVSINFTVNMQNPKTLHVFLQDLSRFSPNVRRVDFYIFPLDASFSEVVSNCICRWQNLQTVICTEVALDANALAHLSRMRELTLLRFSLSIALPDSDLPLFFPNLHHLTLRSKSWNFLLSLLSRVRLPAIADIAVTVPGYPSRLELSSFFACLQTSSDGNTIEKLRLEHTWDNAYRWNSLLGPEDLRPCMRLSNIRHIVIDIGWKVSLTDRDLLRLSSAWPRLEKLSINSGWGWSTPGGITPDGLIQLLQTCRSLHLVALAIDTRGYTKFSRSQGSLGLTLPRTFSIDVVDSIIEAESVPAVAAFFASIAPHPDFSFNAWRCWVALPQGWEVYRNRWDEVFRRARDAVSRRS